ncbi:hypothetical protein J3E69DRAFT_345903, partial [Trichoderma sp. SZMC 28015]
VFFRAAAAPLFSQLSFFGGEFVFVLAAAAPPFSQLSFFGGEFVFFPAAAAVISLLLVICCFHSSEENS